jgi:hypothetical protein
VVTFFPSDFGFFNYDSGGVILTTIHGLISGVHKNQEPARLRDEILYSDVLYLWVLSVEILSFRPSPRLEL